MLLFALAHRTWAAFCLLILCISTPSTAADRSDQAFLIGTEGPSSPNQWIALRRQFEFEGAGEMVVAEIAVDSKYWLWINGKQVVFEGGLKRDENSHHCRLISPATCAVTVGIPKANVTSIRLDGQLVWTDGDDVGDLPEGVSAGPQHPHYVCFEWQPSGDIRDHKFVAELRSVKQDQ